MRILLLNRAFYPDTVATSQYATDIAHDLKARGHDVTVLSGRRDYTMPQKLYPPFEVVDGISVYRVSSTNFGKNSLVARILDAVSYDLASLSPPCAAATTGSCALLHLAAVGRLLRRSRGTLLASAVRLLDHEPQS